MVTVRLWCNHNNDDDDDDDVDDDDDDDDADDDDADGDDDIDNDDEYPKLKQKVQFDFPEVYHSTMYQWQQNHHFSSSSIWFFQNVKSTTVPVKGKKPTWNQDFLL